MSLKIEKLSQKFVSQVAKIESELISNVSEESIASTIENDVVSYFVLIDENKVCGFLECSIIAPESELYEIAISKDCQGKGYSKILMDFYLKLAKEKMCETIFLEVNNINMKAINLYKSYGFVEFGRRKNYYGSNDAILMKLMI